MKSVVETIGVGLVVFGVAILILRFLTYLLNYGMTGFAVWCIAIGLLILFLSADHPPAAHTHEGRW